MWVSTLGLSISDPTREPDTNPTRNKQVWVENFDPNNKQVGFDPTRLLNGLGPGQPSGFRGLLE